MSEGKKLDDGKPRYDLIPALALHEYVMALTFGAEKYGPQNWRLVNCWQDRYFAAAQRHLWEYRRAQQAIWSPNDKDPTDKLSQKRDSESGLHHLAHAMACISFILELELSFTESVAGLD